MTSFVFFLLIGIGVSSANLLNYCAVDKCLDVSPHEELRAVNFLPNKEELKRICPNILKFFDCEFDNIKECNGVGIEELVISPNKSISALASLILSIGSLAADICDENAQIHKDYVKNAECFREFITGPLEMECLKESRELALGFYESLNVPKDDEETVARVSCLETPLVIACAANRIQQACGQSARGTFVNIVRRIKAMIHRDCPSAFENLGTLQSGFLEYANLPDARRDIYQTVFDAMLNRRR